ncbi:RING-H2 finger protein ATL3-like [Iris pallida]|uniref:RING-type E3 ubiquitin transferase n=1 Tax=Iris pallida TaxID=29817 RepID=A0AAX6F8T4_IRIPA|nr:RING-H2 finger protein ATL3-like [Iris pallida]
MDQNTGGTPTTTVSAPRGYVLSGKLLLSGTVVLFGIVVFILLLHLYVRWHVRRRHDRRRRRNRLVFATSAEEEDRSRSAPRRLDREVLNSLATETFSGRGGNDVEAQDATECAVCLNEFDEGEKVRVLPRCGHRFHVGCIDMWFCSHSTCPLCRQAVEAVRSPAPPVESARDSAVLELAVPDPGPRIGEVRIEIPEEAGSSSGTGVVPVKLPGHRRMSSIRRFFIGDVRVESTDRASSPPPPPPPATAQ